MIMRLSAALMLTLALPACVTPQGQGPGSVQAIQRLPPLVGTFARAPISATIGANDQASQVGLVAYRQIAGTAFAVISIPNAPDPAAATGYTGPGIARAMERAILNARLRAASEGATLTVRHQISTAVNNQPMLRCWVTEVTRAAAPQPGQAPAGPQLRTECVGLVVDRFVTFNGVMPDTPSEMREVLALGANLLRVLRDPNAPVVNDLRSIPLPGTTPPAAPPTPPAEAVPTPPGTRRGRGYSI